MRRRTHVILSDVPGGYVLNPCRGFFSVIVPAARTNLITNPSFELATTNWTAVGGSIARSTTEQYHGAYSLAITPSAGTNSDGAFFGTVSLTSGTTYAYSLKLKGTAGRKYTLSIATTGGVDLTAATVTATGRWQWVYGYWTETSSTTRRVYIRKASHNDANVFYIDGVQIEACGSEGVFVTTYIDGDQQGLLTNQFPYPYYWTGSPHASTSVRLATTRAGGRVLNLDRFRYRVIGYAGLGLTLVANIAAIPAAADGGTYQSTIARPRSFAISGFFDAKTLPVLDQARSDMYDAIGPDSVAPRQPVKLLYQSYEGLDPTSQMGTIVASYEHGLEGTTANHYRDTAPMTFTAWLPTIRAGDGGVALPQMASLTNANGILTRSATGTWSAMGTGGAGLTLGVEAFARANDGTLYVGGDFTGMGGVANTASIAKWNGSAWSALTTSLNAGVKALAMAPDGTTLYVGGVFTNADGIANADAVASWSGSAWSALSTGANNTVNSLAVGPDGTLYAGGAFTTIGGVAIDRIAKWNGSAWSVLAASGANGSVLGLAFGLDGNLYAVGSFTSIGGVAANAAAYWDGSAWNAMPGLVGTAQSVTIGPNGAVYVGGSFTGTYDYAAMWNGTGWTQLGTLDATVWRIYAAADGLIYAAGAFTTSDGVSFPNHFAAWNGSTWVVPDVLLPAGVPNVRGLFSTPDGAFYIGFDVTGSGSAPVVTDAVNNGSARTYPTFYTVQIAQSSNFYRITNYTNGKTLYFNYSLAANELLTITCTPTGTRVMSNFRGDVTFAVLPGSSPDFILEKGSNLIAYAMSKTTGRMIWPIAHQSISDLSN